MNMVKDDVNILYVGDCVVMDDVFQRIVVGYVDIHDNVVVPSTNCIMDDVSYDDVSAAHDSGRRVYESSVDFVGLWR